MTIDSSIPFLTCTTECSRQPRALTTYIISITLIFYFISVALDLLLLYLAGAWEIFPALIISMLFIFIWDVAFTMVEPSTPFTCIICYHNVAKAFLMYTIMAVRALILAVGSFHNESLSSLRDVYITITVLWYYGVGGTLALQNH